jgi:predicted nucleic acid-binding Zn ribbon protein
VPDEDPERAEESARDAAAGQSGAGPREGRGGGWTEDRSDEGSRRLEAPRAAERSEAKKQGIELAREALEQAKADARKRGSVPGSQSGSQRRRASRPARERGRSGDPRPFGAAIRDLLADRGWEQRAAVGGVFGNWSRIVGPDLAGHTTPERFEDGELVVAADSTAWATQLRLLASTLVRRLNEELGDGTVRRVKVTGPASGPPRRGGWRVR